MYSVSGVEKKPSSTFVGIKLFNNYRYYAIIFETTHNAIIINLLDKDGEPLEHFLQHKTDDPIESVVIKICEDYDKFWYPEIFEQIK
jgi:negative regulator of sigma E activity